MKRGLWVCLLLAGCASPPVSYYQLSARAIAAPAVRMGSSVMIGPVALPAALDRPQMVVAGPEGQLRILDQARWAGPLPRMVSQTLADDVARELGLTGVHAFPQPSAVPSDFQVYVDIRAWQAVAGQGVHLDAGWEVAQNGKTIVAGRCVADQPVSGAGVDALVRAHDLALQALGHELADALRPLVMAHP